MTNGTRRGWGVSVTPRPLFTPGKDPVQEAGLAPGPVWTGAENLAPTGIRSPDRPARSQSLYRVRYPAHYKWVLEIDSTRSQSRHYMVVSGQLHAPADLLQGSWKGRWVGPREGQNISEKRKIFSCRGNETWFLRCLARSLVEKRGTSDTTHEYQFRHVCPCANKTIRKCLIDFDQTLHDKLQCIYSSHSGFGYVEITLTLKGPN